MPPYTFPTSEELIKDYLDSYLSNLSTNRQPQAAESQSDPMTGATLEGLRQNGGNIPQQQPILNGLERQYADNILRQKIAYNAAQNDAQRQAASMNANMLRQAAQGAGMDLSGYGSDVSLQDAMQNLQTNDARALVEMFQGKYSKSSDQFYNDKFRELVNNGMPVGRAQRAAGEFARQYQGERVSYLNGMLHGYGFDGRVVTPVGQQIVGELASENPQLANMYLNANPGQKDAYNTDNQMALAALQNQGIMDRLDEQIAGNLAYLAQSGQQALEQQNNQGRINRENATHTADLNYGTWRSQQEYIRKAAMEDLTSKADATYQLMTKYIGKEKADKAMESYFVAAGVRGAGSKSAESTDKLTGHLIDTYKAINDRIKALESKTKTVGVELTAEEQQELEKYKKQAADVYTRIEQVTTVAGEPPKFKGKGNEDADLVSADIIRKWGESNGYSEEDIAKVIYEDVLRDTGDKEYAKQLSGIGMK